MQLLVDKNIPTPIKEALDVFGPDYGILASGNCWINVEDDKFIALFIMNDKEFTFNFNNLQASIVEAQATENTTAICVVIDPNHEVKQHQVFAIQEMGCYTIMLDSIDRLPKFITFIADPKRRSPKKLVPSRDFSLFTPGERFVLFIPGVGPKKVSSLMRSFGSIKWVVCAMTDFEQVNDVPGISEKDVQAFKDMLGLGDDEYLTVETKESKPIEPEPKAPKSVTKSVQPVRSTEVRADNEQIKIEF